MSYFSGQRAALVIQSKQLVRVLGETGLTLVQTHQCLFRIHVHSTHTILAHLAGSMPTFSIRDGLNGLWHENTQITHISSRIIKMMTS